MKLEDVIATVTETLLAQGVSQDVVRKVEKDLQTAQAEEKESRVPAKKTKNQFTILVSDPKGLIPKGTELLGWTFKVEDGAAPTAILQRIKDAAVSHNNSKRGRKAPVSSVGETIQNVKRAHWKADDGRKTLVQTPEPVFVNFTDNKL